ncbi:hypothetical protein HPB50_007686 [Hyalomma asiaticum]|uniref:Uncharacterized protein n=1 Tax=Hyalomma asiaticum TaxID=266040 RepID=A0ACB7STB2_HYAAI|nr:hypothetical protein HPB50_007686 [Hyalomma asiaticum]
MAGTVAALAAALLALFDQFYTRGVRIWFDHGLSHLFRYLLAVVQLTYLLRRKDRRFRYLETEHNDDVVNNGAICAPLEWSHECPLKREQLAKGQDVVLFYGVNTRGDRLVVNVSRLRNHLAQLWIALYTADGAQYSLPVSLTLDRSEGSSFSAAGLRLQCLAPNRRWRVAFNGLLSWSAVSHTLEMPAELAPTLLAERLAEMSTFSMLCDASSVSYGSIYAPVSVIRPIDSNVGRVDDAFYAERSKLDIRSGELSLPIDVKRVGPFLALTNDENPGVRLAGLDLKCEDNIGSGFIISISNGYEQGNEEIPEHIKHRIIEDDELPKVLPLVSDIRDRCSKAPHLTGGKGSSLATLDSIATQLETFSVPRGFIVTTKSYELFSANEELARLVQQIEASIGRNESSVTIRHVCSMKNAPHQCTIRTDEDTVKHQCPYAPTANALERTAQQVVRAVVKCWASQYSFTNVNYKRQYGQPLDVPMAVVVQELVEPTAAGVMFTCDPLTGSPSYVTVTANYGIGESVVSASADPDTFVLKKTGARTVAIESKQIGHKSVYTTRTENGEVATVPLSSEKAQTVCMNDEDIERLAIIGMQIERTYTIPQDIEWAFSDGKFFMLQSRPVTTFLRETESELIHEFDNGLKSAKEIFTKGNISEVLPGAMPPLTSSFLRVAFDIYCKGQQRTGQDASLMDRTFIHSVLGRDANDEVTDAVKRVKEKNKLNFPQHMYYLARAMLTINRGVEETSRKTAELRLSVDGMTTAQEMYDYICHSLRYLRKVPVCTSQS